MRYQATLTIPIVLTRDAPAALHDQIAEQVGAAVDRGLLVRGSQLPSTRTLASLLGVSRGVTTAAYEILFARGYLHSQRGSGTYVSRPAPLRCPGPDGSAGPDGPARPERGPAIDLRPGRLAPEAFPIAAWRTAWRSASFGCPPTTGLPALGRPELRRAVADHLLRTRGIPVDEAAVVVTAGIEHGLRVVLDALGLDPARVAVEEPSPPQVRRTVAAGGATPPTLPVDVEGARLDDLPPACRAIVVRPDANVPLGGVLSARRRHEAAAWASGAGGHVVELACDAVVRPEAGGLPRLRALAPAASVLIGGFCELFTPALKLGYAVVPDGLVEPVGRRIRDRGEQPSYVAQLAVASLLADGTAARLMRRRARAYATKRHIVRTTLSPLADDRALGIRIAGRNAVDTAVLYLPDGSDADAVATDLAERGIRVATLVPYHGSDRPAPPALVIGYGHQPDGDLRRACLRLLDALTS